MDEKKQKGGHACAVYAHALAEPKARPPWADGRAPPLAATDDTLLAPNAQKS